MTEVEREGEACALRAVPMWVFSGYTRGKPQLGASSAALQVSHRAEARYHGTRCGGWVHFPQHTTPCMTMYPFPRSCTLGVIARLSNTKTVPQALGKKLAGFNWPKLGRRPRRSALRCIMDDSFDTPSQMPQTQTSAPVTYFACS